MRDRGGAVDNRLLLALAAVAVAFAAADTYVVVLALPDIMTSVGLAVDELQRAAPIVSGFLLGYVAVLPLVGRIADLRGRLPVLVAFTTGACGLLAIGSTLFLLLRPEIPANHYVVSKARNADNDARFRAELDRCEKNEPENIHCAIARSAMARLWTGERGLESARDKLVALSHRGNRNVPFLIELSAVLRATGEMKRADAVERRIASLTDDS